MGVVHKARHRQLDKDVALKVVLPGAPADRFLREARLLAKIRSPYVVAVHDFDILADGSPILVMEWVEGTDLAKTLRSGDGPLPEDRVLPWMRQVAEGMLTVAEEGIIHRDLKPSNILIDHQGRARVADFGLARGPVSLADLSLSGNVMGTPHYMAPEQAETPRNVDTRADIYSFGAAFYHVLTGRVPFEGESVFSILFKHKTEPLVAPQARNPDLSERTSAVLERCLAKSVADRFSSFAEVRDQLESAPGVGSPWEEVADTELAPHLARYQQQRSIYMECPSTLNTPDVYEFPGGRMLKILHGNIVQQEVDAIVSSNDEYLSMGGGVSAAIRNAAGSALIFGETRKYVPVRLGRVVVTSAGQMKARFVFHGVTLAFRDSDVLWPSRDLISEILHSCIYHADTLHVRSLALPLLGTGLGRIPPDVCLDTMFQFLARTFLRGLTSVREARIVLFG
jgi:serine/threonine protein kinase